VLSRDMGSQFLFGWRDCDSGKGSHDGGSMSDQTLPVLFVTGEFFEDAMRLAEARRIQGYGTGGRDSEQEITFHYQTKSVFKNLPEGEWWG